MKTGMIAVGVGDKGQPAGLPRIEPEACVRQVHAPLVFDGNHSLGGYLRSRRMGNAGRIQAEKKKPKPISTRNSERNCPRVNGPVSGASGSRKSSPTMRKIAYPTKNTPVRTPLRS